MCEIPDDLKAMNEASKLDTTTFVGSEIRTLIGRIARLEEQRRKLMESKITQDDWKRLNRVFKTTNDKTIDQDIEIERLKLITEDLSMFIRMMVTKHRRGKLDEEYCQKALDYLQRKGLQGNVLRAI